MSVQAVITVVTIFSIVPLLAFTRLAPDFVMLAALAVFLVSGILTPQEAIRGFSNEGLITVALLYIVAVAIRDTGALDRAASRLLGKPRSIVSAQARLMIPTAFFSAFTNNTPQVAVMLPIVRDWARKNFLPVSKLLLPLSYATILGGLCSLIGTSTNLVVQGLLLSNNLPGMSFFEMAKVGIPLSIIGITYMMVTSKWLLPDRTPAINREDDPRSYTVEMLVEPASTIAGLTIDEAGLRHLPGTYLMEVEREGQIFAAVGPDFRLAVHDRLVFVGIVEAVLDLQRIRGLQPATNQVFKLDGPRTERRLIETVVSNSNPLVGKSIRDGRFRSLYNAAVIAVARNGERIRSRIGDIVLKPGDTLLLEASPTFAEQQRNSSDFFLVSLVDDFSHRRHNRAWAALLILTAMIFAMTFEWTSEITAAMVAAVLVLAAGCCSIPEARNSIDWEVLIVIGASLGLGRAMTNTGAALTIANFLHLAVGSNPWLLLAAIYGVTMIFTEVMSNNAAAALMFPIVIASAQQLDVNYMPFVIAITVAASCGFATPIGYQTNLMVYGPGGYRYGDYLRFGGLLNIVTWIAAVSLIPWIWPF